MIRSEAGAIAAPHGPVLREQADLMARQIEWHLARARAAGAHGVLGARAAVADVARDLEFSLERLYHERALEIELRELNGLVFQGDAQDLEEMLGNLMDNACKWATLPRSAQWQPQRHPVAARGRGRRPGDRPT